MEVLLESLVSLGVAMSLALVWRIYCAPKPRQQSTWVYCPGCGEDLCTNGAIYTDTDLVRYACPCGMDSEWMFDAPVPLLVASESTNPGAFPLVLVGRHRPRRTNVSEYRKTVAVDFDGVIHSYTSGWKGHMTIPDPPVPGAFEWLAEAVQRFEVAIYSTRFANAESMIAVREWLHTHGLPVEVIEALTLSAGKPPAVLYIDDRGHHFTGIFPTLDEIDAFQPWNKQ